MYGFENHYHVFTASTPNPSSQYQTKREFSHSRTASTSMMHEQHSISHPHGSSSMVTSREAVHSSEDISLQSSLELTQRMRRRESGVCMYLMH